MIWALALALWATLAAGTYLLLSRDVLRCVVGLALLGSAVNLLLLGVGRSGSLLPAIVPDGQALLGSSANPVPQALVLTAIVIGFATTGFVIEMALRSRDASGTDHVDGQEPRR